MSLAGSPFPGLTLIGGVVSFLVVDRLRLVGAYVRNIDRVVLRLAGAWLLPGFSGARLAGTLIDRGSTSGRGNLGLPP